MVNRDCWGEFGFGTWGRRGRRRFRWKVFERGDLKFVILRLISEKPMHGYEVMQALEEESGGMYKPSPGSVYPTLQMLEDEGLVRSKETDGKKVYEITDEGRAHLEENGDLVDEIFERVESFADRFLGKNARELSAAFSRLAQTTFEGAFAWEMTQESLNRMTEILEDARRAMEDVRGKSGGGRKKKEKKDEAEETSADA